MQNGQELVFLLDLRVLFLPRQSLNVATRVILSTPVFTADIFHFSLEYLANRRESLSKVTEMFHERHLAQRGSGDLILLSMVALANTIFVHPTWSLSKCSVEAAQNILAQGKPIFSPKTLRAHWKRLHDIPDLYRQNARVFPPRQGRPARVLESQEILLVNAINARLSKSGVKYARIYDFQNIIFQIIGAKVSMSWTSRFLKRHGFIYSKPVKTKVGTRYHDSDIVLQERILFLLSKIWYLAWEQDGKVYLFVHDESWINEKPSALLVWSSKTVRPGNKIEGRRFAFSGLWSLLHGLSCGLHTDDEIDSKVRAFKNSMDESTEFSLADALRLFEELEIVKPTHISLAPNGKLAFPDELTSPFFCFDVKTANQNRGVSRQMDGNTFLASFEKMVEHIIKYVPTGSTAVIQVDNATYHREPADDKLRSVKSEYPRTARGTKQVSPGMIDYLKRWNIKPESSDETFWDVIPSPKKKRTKNKSAAEVETINSVYSKIDQHKAVIKRLFRTAPQYRHQKTRLDELAECLSEKHGIQIKILWGTRGHSELAEIEYSWNFMKRFIKELDPLNAQQTLSLLQISHALEYCNRQSWRDTILLTMECYLSYGYFSRSKLNSVRQNKVEVLEKFKNLFNTIVHEYEFSQSDFNRFCTEYRSKMVRQLPYSKIPEV